VHVDVQHTSYSVVQQEAQVYEQHDTSSDLAVQAISHKELVAHAAM